MTYDQMEERLVDIFEQNNFNHLATQKKHNTKRITLDSVCGDTGIYITYPGYKSKVTNNKVTYDYRVNITKGDKDIALSHVNILIDLYNKYSQLRENRNTLLNLVHDLARNGDDYNRDNYQVLDNYNFNSPNKQLIDYTQGVHNSLGKNYNHIGNSWNYTLDELAYSIIWIVLQEDINYPMPRYQGRRMSFYRYLEALFCCEYPDSTYQLEDVIKRALSHSRPTLWQEPNIDYTVIKNLYLQE